MSSATFGQDAANSRAPLRSLAVLGLAFFVISGIGYLATIRWNGPIPHDATTLVVGRDFMNFWMYGRAAVTPDPGRFYDWQVYNQALMPIVGSDDPGLNWSYPPSIMLLAAPFGQLPYLAALLLWTVLSLALFLFVARRHVDDRKLILPIVLSPAAFLC